MNKLRIATIAGLLSLAASPAFAHVGLHADGTASGLLHPFSGLDHVLAMVAVGLFAARLGGRALWAVPASFVGVMMLGGALGYSGLALPYVEPAIALSVIGMGALLAFEIRLKVPAAMALVGGFALFHGHAHGAEGAHLQSFAGYAAGFVVATTLLHVAGIGLGLALEKGGARIGAWGRRAAGLVGCVAGAMLLAG